ncbi:MAG: DNA-3-methyladenine glycosylase 2 family protein [Oscillospiraceae bacterium]|nr:DNA-3-methyladenine glycosylase 2 family protein [Oscillospiraceae bacterium]
MEYLYKNGVIEFCPNDDFDPVKIFECGQCFRWNAEPDGSYTGVAMGRAANVKMRGDTVLISGEKEDFTEIWHDYFDLGTNYGDVRRSLCIDDYMREASDYGAGIRILNQDRWEALCSFIISQCNNIPRIKKIVEALCALFGDRTELYGREYFTFPTAERLAALTADDLAPIRSGYRAPYIVEAAKAVASGEIDLDRLSETTPEEARRVLKSINGIGDKVANCAILFSLRMTEAFPIDVWMKKAIAEHYGSGFDPKIFGKYAGLAQQYMFYFQREEKNRE